MIGMEERELELFGRIRKLLHPHMEDRVKNIEHHLEPLKSRVKEWGEPGTYDYMLISIYSLMLLIERLHESTRELVASSESLETSSKRLERLTTILILLTIILAIFTLASLLRTQ